MNVADLRGHFFIDTNVFVYSFDPTAPQKQQIARGDQQIMPLCQHFPSFNYYAQALSLQVETGYAWYDALVVAAAIESKCTTWLSEDLQHNRKVRNVTILDPFI